MKLSKRLLVSHLLVAVLTLLIVAEARGLLWGYGFLFVFILLLTWGTSRLMLSEEHSRWARTVKTMAGRVDEHVEEVQRERKQSSVILAALVEGVVAVDHESRILLLNPAAEKLFGVNSQLGRGRPSLEILRQSSLQDVIQRTLQSGQAVTEEIAIHSPEEKTLLVHALPVSYEEGRVGALAAFHDISEIRKLENIRREFVANVSHELRTPLTSIKGYTETLLSGALEDPMHNRAFVQTIQDHTNQLHRLIEDVLALSAIEAKKVEYRWEAIALQDVAARLIKGLAPMAKAKNVTVDNQLAADLPKVRADKDKLAQILMNLIDNAIKFNRDGGHVEINATPGKGVMTLTVKDTAAGIAPSDLPRIFERFYRANKAHTHDIVGTGLGLAIVKHLTEAHQGTITVESIVGKGSTFILTLPLA